MFEPKNIQKGKWWDTGYQLVGGCTKVSPACDNCWAISMENRFGKPCPVKFMNERLKKPFPKTKPKAVAIWNDLFHESVNFSDIARTMDMIHKNQQHLFLVLTKRPERMARYFKSSLGFPKNMMIGTTIESMDYIERLNHLLKFKGKKFLSLEPLLGSIDLEHHPGTGYPMNYLESLDWVVVGCESGAKRRETKTGWISDIVRQCKDARTPVFVKQMEIGGKVEKNIEKFPANSRCRELP